MHPTLPYTLQAPEGTLSRKKLRKAVLAQVAAKHAVDPNLAELKSMFDAILEASSKFNISGSVVTLKA